MTIDKKKKPAMCDCVAKVHAAMPEDMSNTRIVATLSGRCALYTEKVDSFRRGKGSKARVMIATYCPFCGKKYP